MSNVMETRHRRGRALRAWRNDMGIRLRDLGIECGDARGGQLQKFEMGQRELPLPLATRVSQHTEIPLCDLLSPAQVVLARRVFALLARDAAA